MSNIDQSLGNSEAHDGTISAPSKASIGDRECVAFLTRRIGVRGKAMQKFFFDMKDGVPMRDKVGIDFNGNLEAIEHCKELAQHVRDDSLRDDKDLESRQRARA